MVQSIFIVVTALLVATSGATCPPGCQCDVFSRREVYCNYLSAVPTTIPKNTRKVILYGGQVGDVNSSHLTALKDVEELIIQYAGLTKIAPGTFHGFDRLRKLDLSRNKLGVLENNSFIGCANLTSLILYENNLSELRHLAFHGPSNLVRLDLFSNNIKHLRSGVFEQLSNLERLTLNRNSIETIHSGSFRGLSSLKILDLWSNHVSSFDTNAFEGLCNLEELILKQNILSDISEDVFRPLASLKVLDMRSNSVVPRRAMFRELNVLKSLVIGNNGLAQLPPFVFQGLENLRELQIDSNRLTHLHKDVFVGLDSLEELHIDENRILTIDDDALTPLKALTTLSLMGNGLNLTDGAVFNKLHELETLNLARNRFSQIPANMNLTRLHKFVLAYNRLTTLPSKLNLENSAKIHFLDLGNNQISHLDGTHISMFTRLRNFGVANNRIQKFNERDLRPVFSKLTERLDLRGNPVICDCEIAWLKNLTIRGYFPDIRCASPHTKLLFSGTTANDLVC